MARKFVNKKKVKKPGLRKLTRVQFKLIIQSELAQGTLDLMNGTLNMY